MSTAAIASRQKPVLGLKLFIRELNVDGGYLMRLVQGPELPNFIDLYLQMLEQMLSQRSRESVPELRARAPRPYPDVSDSD